MSAWGRMLARAGAVAPSCDAAADGRAGVVVACGGAATGGLVGCYRPLLDEVRRAHPTAPVELAVVGEPGSLPDGGEVRSVSQALDALARAGAARAAVLPALVADGSDLARLRAEVASAPAGLAQVALGRPLVSRTSDARRLAEALVRALPQGRNAVTVLVGDGGGSRAGAAGSGALSLLEVALRGLGRPDLWVCPLDADPTGLLRRVAEEAPCAFSVRLVPLMMAAGDLERARIGADAGESLRAALERSLYGVEVREGGLVSLIDVRSLLLEHLDEALRQLAARVPGAPAAVEPAAGGQVAGAPAAGRAGE
ncbi:sirohydrochlorin cobaltochelatase [Olsenella sp. YH-ols2223]|uniref:Sirohydrochlorin cobaltochelatase n=1 Tax=Olsenella absiana TaxID=3115222 RepID=A0ABU7R923_9ACTN